MRPARQFAADFSAGQRASCFLLAVATMCGIGSAFAADTAAASGDLPVSSMSAAAPFDAYLKADPILLQYGGARVIVLPESNQVVIVSVARTAVKDNSGADRIRMEKVCHQKALAGLLAEKQGLKVRYALETRDTTTSVFAEGREQTASLESMLETSSAQTEGFVRDLPVVGSWYSADGKLFFLAIGAVRTPMEPGR